MSRVCSKSQQKHATLNITISAQRSSGMHHLDVVLRGLLKLEDVVAVQPQHVACILDHVLVHDQPGPAQNTCLQACPCPDNSKSILARD